MEDYGGWKVLKFLWFCVRELWFFTKKLLQTWIEYYVFACLSVFFFIYPFISLFVLQCAFLSDDFFVYVCRSVLLFFTEYSSFLLFVYLSICLFVFNSALCLAFDLLACFFLCFLPLVRRSMVGLSICLSVTCRSVCVFDILSVHFCLPIYIFACFSVFLSFTMSMRLSGFLFVSLSDWILSVGLLWFVWLSFDLIACLYVGLFVLLPFHHLQIKHETFFASTFLI